jgi:electron transfer flavoprotein beta subunit
VSDGTVRITRDTDTEVLEVEAPLPAMVSVTDQVGEARYPSFKGIMAGKKKPVETITLADLGIAAGAVGTAAATTVMVDATPRPPRQAGEVVTDDGTAADALLAFLVGAQLA